MKTIILHHFQNIRKYTVPIRKTSSSRLRLVSKHKTEIVLTQRMNLKSIKLSLELISYSQKRNA